MIANEAWDFFGYTLIVIAIAGGIMYVIGRMHEKEKWADEWDEGPLPAYYCCDHCFHPVTGEHYVNDDDVIKFRPDRHTVPCSEGYCVKGKQVNVNAS